MVILTQKFRIHPTPQQEKILWDLAETCRLLYNHALAERKYLYQAHNHLVTYNEQQNALPLLKKRFPRYQQIYSKILQMTLKKLDAAYQGYFGLKKHGDQSAQPPTFRGKNYFFTLCYNQSGFKITPKTIHFSHKHPQKTDLIFSVPFDVSTFIVKQIEIFQDRYDHFFYLAVTAEQEDPPFHDNGLYQAFDLGTTKHTAINLQGMVLESTVKRPDKYWYPKIRSLQQRISHCKHGSKRHWLFHQRLVTINRKCRNQTKDWQHKQSLNFLQNTKAHTLIVGKLSPKQMTDSNKKKKKVKKIWKSTRYQKSVNRGVHNTGHLSRFIEFLTYKAQKLGKRVIAIDERDTSKTCAECGHKKTHFPLYERVYQCEVCGICRDRDQNAVINIMKRFLSQYALWTGYQSFLTSIGNLRHTVKGKTTISSSLLSKGFCELVGNHLL